MSRSLFRLFFILLFLLTTTKTGYCANGKPLQIKGSDTMVNLAQSWAEAFMESDPEANIAVTGGGSGTGIAAILSGTCDIAQSSRDLTSEEKAKAENTGAPIQETVVAYDGIAVVVNTNNPVSQLTLPQLADIFSGKIQNWKEVGGKDSSFLVLSRERNSGTHVFFLEHVVRRDNAKGPEEFSTSALMMPSSQAIAEEVQTSEESIGYVGLGYVTENQKVLAIAKDEQGPWIKPTIETVLNGQYPIARPLLFLTRGEAKGTLKEFIDFVTGPEGQEIVHALDFVPLKK